MKEFMYDIDVGLIAGILLVSTVAALEVGYRVGVRVQGKNGRALPRRTST